MNLQHLENTDAQNLAASIADIDQESLTENQEMIFTFFWQSLASVGGPVLEKDIVNGREQYCSSHGHQCKMHNY
jgi:hypothetical protein